MLVLSLHKKLHLAFAMFSLIAGSAGIAIADVTIDACVTQNSISHPSLADDMQSLCGLSSSIGALIGFSLSGFFVHLVGPKEVVGSISAIGAVGSLFGVLIYQNLLRNKPFRGILFWLQLLYGASGLLDLVLVLRINLKIGVPDYFFAVIDAAISLMIGRIKWMPLLVLSSKLCPAGIEGTFFALLMSIDHVGLLSSSSAGGLLLHILKVTRTQFDNLWVAILIRSLLRIVPVGFLFLIPKSDPNLSILSTEMMRTKKGASVFEPETAEMVSLINSTRPELGM
ncbi:hypothetical protein I3760_02G163200 [Carya illinoinensis]|nr:hypothetical protein I3760_02G163200 [Carya illinoinensis]